jgi:hypothetical protein
MSRGRRPRRRCPSPEGVDVAYPLGAPEVDLVDAQQIGLPRFALVNVDGSKVITAFSGRLPGSGPTRS